MSDISFARSFPLLMLLLCGAAILFFLLAGLSLLQSWLSNKRRDLEAIEWGPPRPGLLQRWRTKLCRIRLRLPGLRCRECQKFAPKPTPSALANAPADPLKKPTQPVLALFGSAVGAPNGKPKEGFIWEKTKGIE
jgi:hypothetical protein